MPMPAREAHAALLACAERSISPDLLALTAGQSAICDQRLTRQDGNPEAPFQPPPMQALLVQLNMPSALQHSS